MAILENLIPKSYRRATEIWMPKISLRIGILRRHPKFVHGLYNVSMIVHHENPASGYTNIVTLLERAAVGWRRPEYPESAGNPWGTGCMGKINTLMYSACVYVGVWSGSSGFQWFCPCKSLCIFFAILNKCVSSRCVRARLGPWSWTDSLVAWAIPWDEASQWKSDRIELNQIE